MTRPCVRCGRSIGAGTRACPACVNEIRAKHPVQWQWSGRNAANGRYGLPPTTELELLPSLAEHGEFEAAVIVEPGRPGWNILERDRTIYAAGIYFHHRLGAWLRVIAVEDYGHPNYCDEAVRATTEDLAPIWRLVDVWLWRLEASA